MSVDTPGPSATHSSDTERLHELGYAQELGRKMQGFSMGEVCSSCPTTGGLYYCSAKLAKRNAPFWSWNATWFTGPKLPGTPEELAAIETDLEAV